MPTSSHLTRPAIRRASAAGGRWQNQNGSLLEPEIGDHRAVAGWFESRKGWAARGQRDPLLERGLGRAIGSRVSFSGRLAAAPDSMQVLHTRWVRARRFEDAARTRPTRPTRPWNSVLVNAGVFHRPGEGP